MKHPLIYFLALIMLLACGRSSDNTQNAPALENIAPSGKSANTDLPRKLIRNGSITFNTNNTDESYRFIVAAVDRNKGYIASERTYNSDNLKGYNLTVRVPAANFDKLVSEIVSSGNVKELEEKTTAIDDVTEEFIDVESRLKIKKESELRLLDLLKQAKNVSEIVAINEQLTNLRADIESIEGRLKYLENQVSYSTLEINIHQKTRMSGRFFSEISTGFSEGWQIFLQLLSLLSYLWVIILVVVIAWRLGLYFRRRKRQ